LLTALIIEKVLKENHMKDKTRRNLGTIFGSLISNQRVIDGSKEFPFWVSLIFLVLSVFLPLIPIMTTVANSYGSQILSSATYNLDNTLTTALVDLHNENKTFKVVDNELQYFVDGNQKHLDTTEDLTPIYTYKDESRNQIDLLVFYSERLTGKKDPNNLSDLVSAKAVKYKKGTMDVLPSDASDDELKKAYIPNILVLHKTVLYLVTYKDSSSNSFSGTSSGYNWKNVDSLLKATDLVTYLLTVEGETIPTTASDITSAYKKGVLNNFKKVLDKSYIDLKGKTLLYNTLVFAAVYLGLILFMGLMVWLLTRGKKNMFHFLKLWDCQKISYWASFSPALIAMILGFILPNYASMFFIILIGIRVMWLSMKQLRPQY